MKWNKLTSRASEFAFLLLVFVISLPDRFGILALILWIATFTIDIIVGKRFKNITISKYKSIYIFPILLFTIAVVGTFYYDNNLAGKLVERRLSLLLIPLIGLIGLRIDDGFRKFSIALTSGIIIVFFILLFLRILHLWSQPELYSVYIRDYKAFISGVLLKHPSYWSSFVVIAASIQLFYLSEELPFKMVLYRVFSFFFLSGLVWLMQSRIMLLALCFSTLLFVFLQFTKKIFWVYRLFWVGLVVAVFFLFIVRSQKFRMGINWGNISNVNIESYENRITTWWAGYEVLKENDFKAIGANEIQPALNKKYLECDSKVAISTSLNTHNNFLQLWLESGWFTSMVLILLLFYPLIYIKGLKENILSISFAFICFAFSMVEVILNRFSGVLLISLYLIILNLLVQKETKVEQSLTFIDKLNLVIMCFICMILFAIYIYRPLQDLSDPATFVSKPFVLIDEPSDKQNTNNSFSYLLETVNNEIAEDESFYDVLFENDLNKEDSIFASIMCYVPLDFDGDVVALAIGDVVNGFKYEYFPFGNKGHWATIECGMRVKNRYTTNVFVSLHKFDKHPLHSSVIWKDFKITVLKK